VRVLQATFASLFPAKRQGRPAHRAFDCFLVNETANLTLAMRKSGFIWR